MSRLRTNIRGQEKEVPLADDGLTTISFQVPDEFFEVLRSLAEAEGKEPEEFLEQRVAPLFFLVEHLVGLVRSASEGNGRAHQPAPGYL